jgi:ferric-dicitrate binding protein FerR (iron transport regulator)
MVLKGGSFDSRLGLDHCRSKASPAHTAAYVNILRFWDDLKGKVESMAPKLRNQTARKRNDTETKVAVSHLTYALQYSCYYYINTLGLYN